MMKKIATYTLLILATFTGAALSYRYFGPTEPLPRYAASSLGGDFSLESIDGQFNLSDLRGEVVLLYFGFMSCPDVCPTSMAVMGQAFKQLSSEQQKKVRGLFISVDPARDTVDELAAYTAFFSDRILGLTGTQDQIDALVKQYGAYYKFVQLDDSALGYTVDHSTRIYLIDPDGALADLLDHDINPNELHKRLAAYF